MPASIPDRRIHTAGRSAVATDGRFVVYWMTSAHRVGWNFAFERAVEWAAELGKPLVVAEVLGCGGRWDNARRHRFVIDGMADITRRLEPSPVLHYPLIESHKGEAGELLGTLAEQACLVVTDDCPLPVAGGVEQSLAIRLERVDGNGLLPIRAADSVFPTAYAFRRFLQRELPNHLLDQPKANPLGRTKIPPLKSLPKEISRRCPAVSQELLSASPAAPADLPIDYDVGPVEMRGGSVAARAALERFLEERLPRYHTHRNQPEEEATSGLSPYLHFGHISPHEIFHALAKRERWSPDRLAEKAAGKREGWWGMSAPAEAFLDELVTWRELGLNTCSRTPNYDRYESLPDWARTTLDAHAGDRREYVYSLDEFERGQTHDRLWNAAQRQLLVEGRMHNYLRMLWGKKILQWTAAPREALDVMLELNNKYALDGCDANSYSGIFWVLGRYDRPWGPERPVFGKIRYMSSRNTARKVRTGGYISSYSRNDGQS